MQNITKQNVLDALNYIDENGTPDNHQSYRYELVAVNGKKYSPKYVVAVAAHIATGEEISAEGFNSTEANNLLKGLGFNVQTKPQVKFELCITADKVTSTDERFTMDNLGLGNNYKPLEAYFVKADGTKTTRVYAKGENKISNRTMPYIAFQIYLKQIAALSEEERANFPICKYSPTSTTLRGIFSSLDDFKKQYGATAERLQYKYGDDGLFVIYCWNIFSTINFVQECLKRFGDRGDSFKLVYREKDKKEAADEKTADVQPADGQPGAHPTGYRNEYSHILIESKNLIFRGAPGTGKSYLAKEIAADIVSNGYYDKYAQLDEEQKKQVEFVQFHPSYDYTDFVEGLRPRINADGTMGFELEDGIFKKFVARARKNFEDSQKPQDVIEKELSVQEAITAFFSEINFGKDTFKTINGNEFTITNADDRHIYIYIPANATANKLTLELDDITKMLASGQEFEKIKDITAFFGKAFASQAYSYNFAIYKEILKRKKKVSAPQATELKKYIFIIDEINRGEISKIFGELFFTIDPGYRGPAGEVSTQYANLHSDPNEKFYIPENVYIIGTMNDIDRSVDTFDFAMRRRFRFVELKADDRLEMLSALEDDLKAEAIKRMSALNAEIAKTEDLGQNYQIGAAYFLKLKTLGFDRLWTDHLQPLLQEYVRGMYDEEGILNRFATAYGYSKPAGDDDGAAQN